MAHLQAALLGLLLSLVPASAVMSYTVQVQGLASPIHYLEEGRSTDPLVLFLHGAAFSAQTWQDLGTLDFLARRGLRVIAIDLPGYGPRKLSGQEKLHTGRKENFVAHFLSAIGFDHNVKLAIVEASMGGSFGNPFIAAHPAQVAGFVTVSAAGLDEYAGMAMDSGASEVPCLLYWGEHDSPDSEKASLYERVFKNQYKIVVPNGSHPCYLDDPEMFHNTLEAFLIGHTATALPIKARWTGPYFDL